MDRKLLRNYLYNILYQIVKVVLPLFMVPYTYAHIGAETLGISDFASNIAGWFILFGTLGVNTYGNREIAKVRDNQDDLNRTFFEIYAMQVCNMLIATVCYFIYV
ncbi:MAG: oligosaccharide flippase family protein, partial [Erysipelotrichaceae bacterium]|nr:oligosaccharide flippase family protein [Erysipelotrichaceae bacterium]